MSDQEKFAAPQVEETEADRLARLRAKAALQAEAEFDEDAVFAQMLAEERAKRLAKLSGDAEVELATDTRGFPPDYDVINIFRGQGKQDLPYVPLSLNGLVLKVPRGEDVIIPHAFVVDVLNLCVEDITVKSQGGYVTRPAHRFPYNFIRKATPEEYKAYQDEQKLKAQRETAQAA